MSGSAIPMPAATSIAADAAEKQRDKALALLDALAAKAKLLGAPLGAQRASQVSSHFKRLSAKDAYQWLNPPLFKQEVEDHLSARTEKWYRWRNVFSLLPLILTWLALSLATLAYQQDLQVYKASDNGQSFLSLWQSGFHGNMPFSLTITNTGFTDVILLALCLFFTIQAQRRESAAQRDSAAFVKQLDEATTELLKASDMLGAVMISDDVSAQSVAETIQLVINETMQATRDLSQRTEQLVTQLQGDLTKLHDELNGNQQQLEELTSATSGLTTAAEALAKNAGTYTTIGNQLSSQIGELNTTQQGLVRELAPISGDMKTAATEVSAVSKELTAGLKPSLTEMTQSVVDASTKISTVNERLKVAADEINGAAVGLGQVNIDVTQLNATQNALRDDLQKIGASADSVKTVAEQITKEMQPHIAQIGGNVSSATRDLEQYEKRMVAATDQLELAASELAAAASQLAVILGSPGAFPGPGSTAKGGKGKAGKTKRGPFGWW